MIFHSYVNVYQRVFVLRRVFSCSQLFSAVGEHGPRAGPSVRRNFAQYAGLEGHGVWSSNGHGVWPWIARGISWGISYLRFEQSLIWMCHFVSCCFTLIHELFVFLAVDPSHYSYHVVRSAAVQEMQFDGLGSWRDLQPIRSSSQRSWGWALHPRVGRLDSSLGFVWK